MINKVMDYKDKLRLAKEALDSGSYDKKTIEYIFPELKESEDERTRKELVTFVRGMLECHDKPNAERDEKYESWIVWLEKQDVEQNPCDDCNDKLLNCHNFPCITKRAFDQGKPVFEIINEENEDEKIRKAIHIYLDWLDGRKDYAPKGEYTISDMLVWLEKQGEQWKPRKNR